MKMCKIKGKNYKNDGWKRVKPNLKYLKTVNKLKKLIAFPRQNH